MLPQFTTLTEKKQLSATATAGNWPRFGGASTNQTSNPPHESVFPCRAYRTFGLRRVITIKIKKLDY